MTFDRYAAFVSLGLAPALLNAQVTLSAAEHAPQVGDLFLMQSAPYAAPPAGGEDQHYDMSALVGDGTNSYSWVDASEYSDPTMFPTAQMLLANDDGDTLFYRSTAGGLEVVGEKRMYLGLYVVEAPLSDSYLGLQLPLAYGDAPWTDAVYGSFTVSGNPAVRTGSITGQADAMGMLHLPNDVTTPILRVRTRLTEVNSLNIGFPITVNHIRTEYSYYAPWLRSPILRTVTDTLTSSIGVNQNKTYTEWLDVSVLGIDRPVEDAFGLGLFPNPAGTEVNVSFLARPDAALVLEVVDARGAIVMQRSMGRFNGIARERLDVSALPEGLYAIRLSDSRGARSVQRLTIAR